MTPEMLANRQNNAADFASWVSTQSGRFSSAATAHGTYLASQPNAASQTGVAIQFGMAGTATVIGFDANAVEQLLRPNVEKMTVNSLTEVVSKPFLDKMPIYAPVINETMEIWKNSEAAKTLQDRLSEMK